MRQIRVQNLYGLLLVSTGWHGIVTALSEVVLARLLHACPCQACVITAAKSAASVRVVMCQC